MRILVVGDGIAYIYEEALYDAFIKLGYSADLFTWKKYVAVNQLNKSIKGAAILVSRKFQNKYSVGPIIYRINRDLKLLCRENKYDLVFIYRGRLIKSDTIESIKKTGAIVFGYNNDDPFGEGYPKYFWRHYIGSIQSYDHIFFYRWKNIRDYNNVKYYNISMLRSYYIGSKDFSQPSIAGDYQKNDVIFIGHYEDDGRDEIIYKIIKSGINLKLYGTLWHKSKYAKYFYEKLGVIAPAYENYISLLSNTKIALSFLSKLNSDTYTRRCFEIPACKTFMLCEYTDDMNSMFEEGKEAEYFRNVDECIDKLRYYIEHDSKRQMIAEAGHERLMKDGHEIKDRAVQILNEYDSIMRIK